MTVGPWKPIRLHAYTARLSDVRVQVGVDEHLNAKIAFSVAVTRGASKVHFTVKDPQGGVLHHSKADLDKSGAASVVFTPDSKRIQLWYPVGYGKQPIYASEVQLLDAVRGTCACCYRRAETA